MIYYKSHRIIDGKPKLVIIDEDKNIVKNPTKEQKKEAILEDSNTYRENKLKGRECCVCGSKDTYIYKGIPDWAKHKDDRGILDGKWVCSECDGKERQRRPNSQNSIRKSVTNIRTGNLRIDSETGKSVIDQAVVVKTLGGKDVNIEMDKFDHFIDIKHEKHGSVDAKGAALKSYKYIDTRGDTLIYYKWIFSTRRKVDCNTYICLGYDSERKNIIMAWIIPNEGWVCNLSNIDIYKTFRPSKYDQFKIDPKQYNDVYESLMLYLGDSKVFGIEDIKKWLEMR